MTDRMSDSEAFMWTIEKDPALRSDFLNVTLLDRPPDLGRLRRKLVGALDALPRLRQRVVNPPLRLVPPEWRDDPRFDLDHHLRHLAVPPPGTTRQLLDLAATVAAQPFDRARPLWDLTVVEGLEGGRAALLQKIHHTVIDGVGGVRFSTALLDLERDAGGSGAQPDGAHPDDAGRDGPAAADRRAGPFDVLGRALADAARARLGDTARAARAAGTMARRPDRLPTSARRAVATARSVRDQVAVAGTARSPLMTDRSLARRFGIHSLPLDAVKDAAGRLGGTVNDVFVTGVAGALGAYHELMGHPVDELRLAMPVNLRDDEEGFGGNRFAPARVVVPVGPKDPRERFDGIRGRLRGARREPALGIADALAGALGMLPTAILVPVARAQTRTVDFVCSNLRGAPFDLYLGGARVEANHPMGPCTGWPVNVTTLSYRGRLDIGVNVDPAAVTDPATLGECLEESFAALLETPT